MNGHTSPQKPPDGSKRHPGTTPVPMFVPEPGSSTSLPMKSASVYDALRAAFKAAETLEGFPRVAEVLSGDLYWKKETRWSLHDDAVLALAAEVQLLVRLLNDPGVQRIAALLGEGREAA